MIPRSCPIGTLLLTALISWPVAAKNADSEAALPTSGIDFADQKSGTPLEVYADQGLELSQDAKTVIARVNAKAIRGRVTLSGDVLTAYYRDRPGSVKTPGKATTPSGGANPDQPGGSSEIWRVVADGHVTIASPTQTAFGDHADYNIDDAVVVMTGQNLRMVTPTDTVTAKDSLEYWEHRNQAVARGKAVALRNEKRIQADVLVADFVKNDKGEMAIERAHGYQNVVLTTSNDVVTGDRADYTLETGIVTVTGSVKLTRDSNQLDGGYAVVNLNTGVSRLFPVAPGGGSERRVKGLFVPQSKQPAPARPDAGQR